MILRDYQIDVIASLNKAWESGYKNVLLRLPTGAGKTVIMSSILHNYNRPTLLVAHRFDLLCQISLTLARHHIYNRIIAPDNSVAQIVEYHRANLEKSYISEIAPICVASIDTVVRRGLEFEPELVIIDEAHHVVRNNKWGRVADSGKRGLFLTATPLRCDGQGLGRDADGFADIMIEGPSTKTLTELGYLSNYKLIGAPCSVDLSRVRLGASGDYRADDLHEAIKNSRITGDIIENYRRWADGKLAICFCANTEFCFYVKAEMQKNAIASEVITAETSILERSRIMSAFRARSIKVLINVDILGEGTDVPEVECVILARPTKSLPVYLQQVGRCLRIAQGKTHGIIIDHVGNWARHGAPDENRLWSLDRVNRLARNQNYEIQIRVCENVECMLAYSRVERECPYCGCKPDYKDRSTPEAVDGDLEELDANVIKRLRYELWMFDHNEAIPQHLPPYARIALTRRRAERREAQRILRKQLEPWETRPKEFYLKFGIDLLSAKILNKKEAELLLYKVMGSY